MSTGEREAVARRFWFYYLCIFLVLIEHLLFRLDVSSQRYYFVSASSFTLFSDTMLIPPLAYWLSKQEWAISSSFSLIIPEQLYHVASTGLT